MQPPRYVRLTAVAAAFFLAACGSDSDTPDIPEPTTFNVTASASAGGSISPASRTVEEGNSATFSVSADTGYDIDSVNGCDGTLSDSTYTTGTITGNCTISAEFTRQTFTISTEVSEGGSWSPEEAMVSYGDSEEFTLSFTAGEFRLVDVSGCDGSLNENTYTTGAITANCTVAADLEVNSAPEVSAGSDQTLTSGETCTVPATGSDEDGDIVSWFWEQVSGPEIEIPDPSARVLEIVLPEVDEETQAVFQVTVTDNDGATASDQITITILPLGIELTDITLVLSDVPAQYESVSVFLDTDEFVGEVNWTVLVDGASELSIDDSNEGRQIDFNADQTGHYSVEVISQSGQSAKRLDFVVESSPSFDSNYLEGFNTQVGLEDAVGVISNQSWVQSSLNESDLRAIVDNYDLLTAVAYNHNDGLLIEFEAEDIPTREQIELLKLQPGVSGVVFRVHIGVNADLGFGLPDDGQEWGEGGANWHLQAYPGANVTEAWQRTTGNQNFHFAILDEGFYLNHEELVGSFYQSLTSAEAEHGTAAAAALAGNTDNEVGVSAVNWETPATLGRWRLNAYRSVLLDSEDALGKVKLVSNSWGPMGNFDGGADFAHQMTRQYRSLAQEHDDVLHVWAAGNRGASASMQNGALHLNNNGGYSPLDNVLVVAAHDKQGRLLASSNYGRTVDISAPSGYLSARNVVDGESTYFSAEEYGLCDGSAFSGTSSATPLVAGAASLVYSMYPGFSPDDVKSILIDSATDFVTHRFDGEGDCNSSESWVELESPIPVLNAASALTAAQAIINSKVTVAKQVPNPFNPSVDFHFNVLDSDLSLDSISYSLSVQNNNDWAVVSSGNSSSASFSAALDNVGTQYQLQADIVLIDSNSGSVIEASKSYQFDISVVDLYARDTVTLQAIEGAQLQLERLPGLIYPEQGSTYSDGKQRVYLESGDYKVNAEKVDFNPSTTVFTADAEQLDTVPIYMTRTELGEVGSLSGTVTSASGTPLSNASIRISGGELTNGFFASATTDGQGYYQLSNISKTSSTGQPIESFMLEVSAAGHLTSVREEVIVLANNDRIENFTLAVVNLDTQLIYETTFDHNDGWQSTGMWNRFPFGSQVVDNSLQIAEHVWLAPNATSDVASTPPPFVGEYAWWYGQPETGSFIGELGVWSEPGDGGRSVSAHSGELVSPSISLQSAGSPRLTFHTWWEIEGVNPNSSGFDLLVIEARAVGDTEYTTLRRLNPFVDPNDTNRAPKAFSSAGYYREPVWVREEFDLSEFAGEIIEIRFFFNTVDGLYNGFRGWVIDNLMILDAAESDSSTISPSLHAPRHNKELSHEFLRMHRAPTFEVIEGYGPQRDNLEPRSR